MVFFRKITKLYWHYELCCLKTKTKVQWKGRYVLLASVNLSGEDIANEWPFVTFGGNTRLSQLFGDKGFKQSLQ